MDHPHQQRESPIRSAILTKVKLDCSESHPRVLVIGKESVGKSQLVASLTGRWAESYNFPGSTVACDCYTDEFYSYIDSPGLLRHSDSTASRETLAAVVRNPPPKHPPGGG